MGGKRNIRCVIIRPSTWGFLILSLYLLQKHQCKRYNQESEMRLPSRPRSGDCDFQNVALRRKRPGNGAVGIKVAIHESGTLFTRPLLFVIGAVCGDTDRLILQGLIGAVEKKPTKVDLSVNLKGKIVA